MTEYLPSTPKAATLRANALHMAAVLAGVVMAIGPVAPALAQAQNGDGDMARCRQLYGAWSRYNGAAYSQHADVDSALENCRKGKYAAGIAELTRALQRAQIPLPPSEAAAASH